MPFSKITTILTIKQLEIILLLYKEPLYDSEILCLFKSYACYEKEKRNCITIKQHIQRLKLTYSFAAYPFSSQIAIRRPNYGVGRQIHQSVKLSVRIKRGD